ncbi:biphenyl 2,3-dioxygenase [Cystobacter fuscus]|uniref:VOC family protein n=1 Tax=Cystobacter fuscus TaxID=43 RepID=UPI002B30E877|nr:biphenyl 2,3-dioxygenase [Cystobacter fuscus]
MTSPTKLAHVVLRTGRFQQMRDWYCKVLEATVAYDNGQVSFLSYDDEHHRIGIVNTGATEQPGPKTRGLEHFAFTYADITGLLHTYERLEQAGITPFWSVNHGPTTSFYYRDPDGNHIELQVDNFVRNEDATSFMRSEVYNSNPIGVDVDPRELLRRLRAGESASELAKAHSNAKPRGFETVPAEFFR